MPSRVRPRVAAEWALRAITLGALGLLLWRWTHPAPARDARMDVAGASTLDAALARWTDAPTTAAHATFDSLPDAERRAWLRAVSRAGTTLTWSAAHAPALAASAYATSDPAGGTRVDVAAPHGSVVAVGDALGAADTVRTLGGGGSVQAPATGDAIVAHAAGGTARIRPHAASALGDAIVVGRAGWETKFVAAALEERGWHVRLRASVAPGIDVKQGALALDSTVAVLVVVDSGAPLDAASLGRYVRGGGGLVLAGDGASIDAARLLAPGTSGSADAGPVDALASATPTRGLTLRAIVPRADAIVLERRDGAPSIAARRVGAGRVVQVGYTDTWRWRMAPRDDAPAAHRAWWARVVAAAARSAAVPNASDETTAAHPVSNGRSSTNDPAPLAATIAALGPPRAAPTTARRGRPTGPLPSDGTLAALAGAALLAEVASRRARGAR